MFPQQTPKQAPIPRPGGSLGCPLGFAISSDSKLQNAFLEGSPKKRPFQSKQEMGVTRPHKQRYNPPTRLWPTYYPKAIHRKRCKQIMLEQPTAASSKHSGAKRPWGEEDYIGWLARPTSKCDAPKWEKGNLGGSAPKWDEEDIGWPVASKKWKGPAPKWEDKHLGGSAPKSDGEILVWSAATMKRVEEHLSGPAPKWEEGHLGGSAPKCDKWEKWDDENLGGPAPKWEEEHLGGSAPTSGGGNLGGSASMKWHEDTPPHKTKWERGKLAALEELKKWNQEYPGDLACSGSENVKPEEQPGQPKLFADVEVQTDWTNTNIDTETPCVRQLVFDVYGYIAALHRTSWTNSYNQNPRYPPNHMIAQYQNL